jgi:hypothetical protein
MKEITKPDAQLMRSNLELIQANKALAKRIQELEARNAALEASMTTVRARRNERIARQRQAAMGGWPKLKTALLGMFNLAVLVFMVVTF